LGNSEARTVDHTPGDVAVPDVGQAPNDGGHVAPILRRQKAWDILDNNPSGPDLFGESHEMHKQTGSVTREPLAVACDRHILTGKPATEHIHRRRIIDPAHIAEVRHVRPARRQDRSDLSTLFRLPQNAAARLLESEIEPADAREQRTDGQRHGAIHITSGRINVRPY
jgi:hypothetical protein